MKITNLTGILIVMLHLASCESKPDYKNRDLPVDQRVEDLISAMTLEEKIHQLSGDGKSTFPNERLDIPAIIFSDGPFGAHNQGKIAAFASGLTIASTWDTILASEIGRVIGLEARAYGVDCVLGPCVNIHRNPLGGRNFESYGEDPFHVSRIAVNYINGLQNVGVMANVKHYAMNNQEWQRHFYDAMVDERALREIYLPAFEASVTESDVASVMSSYNKVNGVYAAQNKTLLTDILKDDWGFRGFVIPDWAGAHSTVESALAGLDLIVYETDFYKEPLLHAINEGDISEAIIDEKLRRIYTMAFEYGLFDARPGTDKAVLNSDEHNALARKLAADGTVLLKNENNLLPLKHDIQTIAVIGPNAAELVYGGGGSSRVKELFYKVSPLEGIKNKVSGNTQVVFEEGVALEKDVEAIDPKYLIPSNTSQGHQGLWGEYFKTPDLKGEPFIERLDSTINFQWGTASPNFLTFDDVSFDESTEDAGFPEDNFSVRWSGKIKPPRDAWYCLKVATDDGIRLFLDGELLIDNWWMHNVERRFVWVELKAGQLYDLKIEYFEAWGNATMQFGWQIHDYENIKNAVNAAKNADAVIIVAGTNDLFESEEYDRTTLDLPVIQRDLIQQITEANTNTIVVLQSGGSLNLQNWGEKVPAIMNMWFPGHEGGNAMADIIFGDVNPSGKLPFSWINRLVDYPPVSENHEPADQKIRFSEGVFVGYRYHDKHNTKVAFPFGFGLSYTSFEFSDLGISQLDKNVYEVTVSVTNTGAKAGAEVVQLYVSDLGSTIQRPVKELKGFSKVFLQPGETEVVKLKLNPRSFSFYDVQTKSWVIDSTKFEILVGNSSRNLPLSHTVN